MVDVTQVVNGKYDETSRGHIRVKVPAIESMFLSSSMGSRVTRTDHNIVVKFNLPMPEQIFRLLQWLRHRKLIDYLLS
jgi:hypothetical protein